MPVRNRRVAVIAAVSLAVLLLAAVAAAKTTFVPVAGTAVQVAPPERVETNCIGGAATGTWPPCTLGSKSQMRGWNLIYRLDFRNPNGAPDPLLTGTRYLVFNGTLDENGNAPGIGSMPVASRAEGTVSTSAWSRPVPVSRVRGVVAKFGHDHVGDWNTSTKPRAIRCPGATLVTPAQGSSFILRSSAV
jgi:hypothetical protein